MVGGRWPERTADRRRVTLAKAQSSQSKTSKDVLNLFSFSDSLPCNAGEGREGAEPPLRLHQRAKRFTRQATAEECGVRRSAPYLTFPRKRGKEPEKGRNRRKAGRQTLAKAQARKARQARRSESLSIPSPAMRMRCGGGQGGGRPALAAACSRARSRAVYLAMCTEST